MNRALARLLNAWLHTLYVQVLVLTWFDSYVEINDRQSNQ